jgi:signal transduction histidine kinase
MAAISAFAENLSDNVATDKREYYAGKIEEKVAQMNKMVNNIQEFSKSENLPAEIKKEDVDVGVVIGKIIADNDHVIAERSLKINCEKKNITIQTDIKLFSQAVSNLINNAVLYSKEGTAIDISFDEKSLVISNTPAKKVDNAAELKQPFAKGSSERGTQGSGLGLAIAENNLAMIGYKLDISSDEGRFVATVRL